MRVIRLLLADLLGVVIMKIKEFLRIVIGFTMYMYMLMNRSTIEL